MSDRAKLRFHHLTNHSRSLFRFDPRERLIVFVFFSLKDKKSLLDELELSKNQYAERDSETVRLQELLERVQADKTKLSRRVSKLVQNGRSKIRAPSNS